MAKRYVVDRPDRKEVEKELRRLGLGHWLGASKAAIEAAIDEYEATGNGLLFKAGRYEALCDYLEVIESEKQRTIKQLHRWYMKKAQHTW